MNISVSKKSAREFSKKRDGFRTLECEKGSGKDRDGEGKSRIAFNSPPPCTRKTGDKIQNKLLLWSILFSSFFSLQIFFRSFSALHHSKMMTSATNVAEKKKTEKIDAIFFRYSFALAEVCFSSFSF